ALHASLSRAGSRRHRDGSAARARQFEPRQAACGATRRVGVAEREARTADSRRSTAMISTKGMLSVIGAVLLVAEACGGDSTALGNSKTEHEGGASTGGTSGSGSGTAG